MKRILPVLVVIVSLWLLVFLPTPADNRKHNYSTHAHNFNNQPFFEVASYSEKYCLVRCGSFHVFKIFRGGDGEWQEITSFRHRERKISFPGKQIKIQNENFAYFWFGWKFGATGDGGKTWTIWDAENDSLMKNSLNYRLIENVVIDEQGRGNMYFNSQAGRDSGISSLRTEDFGKTWHR